MEKSNPRRITAHVPKNVAPHSIVINSTSTTAYVSNEGGRAATAADFQINFAGTEIVADPVVGATITATVSVVDLATLTVTANIQTGGLHPSGMVFYGQDLLVANTYSDIISVINTVTNTVVRTISLPLPIGCPARARRMVPPGLSGPIRAKARFGRQSDFNNPAPTHPDPDDN